MKKFTLNVAWNGLLKKYTNHLTCWLFFAKEKQFKINQSKESFKQEKSTTIEMATIPLGRILAKTKTYIIIGIDVPKWKIEGFFFCVNNDMMIYENYIHMYTNICCYSAKSTIRKEENFVVVTIIIEHQNIKN